MTSLTDAYDRNAREVSSPHRLYAGTGLVLAGAILAILGVVVATTNLFAGFVGTEYGPVKWAGILAGLGVPATLVGVFIVLPAGRRVRAAAAIGASLCLLGVALYWHAYPNHWRGYGDDLTFLVSAVYLLGLFVAVWCLFTGVVNFKTRNDPGGMLEMNVTRTNRTVVEVDESDPDGGLGGIGFLGGTPDGDVETQTNVDDDGTTLSFDEGQTRSGDRTGSSRSATPNVGGMATSDGGSTTQDISSPIEAHAGDGHDAEIVDAPTAEPPTNPTDRYCGNCSQFEYVRTSSGMVPYCTHHESKMDDMDACEDWTPNRK